MFVVALSLKLSTSSLAGEGSPVGKPKMLLMSELTKLEALIEQKLVGNRASDGSF